MDVATLVAAMPGLSTAKATQYLGPMEDAQRRYAITSELRSRMWLAQTGHESVSLRYFEEIASGAAYEGRKDLGNTQPGDGKKYKGRGPIQITGRTNYTNAGKALGLPLVDRPEMAADPQGAAFHISAWWWAAHGLNEISDRGDVVAATKRINGGTNGLSDRQSRYATCTKLGARVVVGAGQPTTPEKPQEVSETMVLQDPVTGGYWIVDGPGGGVHAVEGAPYLGAVNNDKVNPKKYPCVGIARLVDAQKAEAYALVLDWGKDGGAAGRFRVYRFPRNGSAK